VELLDVEGVLVALKNKFATTLALSSSSELHATSSLATAYQSSSAKGRSNRTLSRAITSESFMSHGYESVKAFQNYVTTTTTVYIRNNGIQQIIVHFDLKNSPVNALKSFKLHGDAKPLALFQNLGFVF
jgi:hypothetical protein